MGNIIWGAICIIAGLSGQFVLIGTNSSAALVIAGVGFILWGLGHMTTEEKTTEQPNQQHTEPKHIRPMKPLDD